ncbi:MAG: MBOAT family O-acyltransferase [Candidatus Krumholzibacteriia bacterium]
MLFNSLRFLLFFAVVLLVVPRLSWRRQNLFLLAASYFFYGSWDWRFVGLLLLTTTIDFVCGLRIAAATEPRGRRNWMLAGVIGSLSILAVFKYCGFFVVSFGELLGRLGLEAHLPVLRIVLPVGISFYTFQSLSYTLDIYRGRLEPTRNFPDYALFVSFFPQLVAGPIERARSLLTQVAAPRTITAEHVRRGVALLLVGYFKKVAIADTMAPLAQTAFADPAAHSAGQLAAGLYAFALQIYGDFSGYSDIARGAASLLGFELRVNFNAPYLSRSIAAFWQRWHISLSSWVGDYLFQPLLGAATRRLAPRDLPLGLETRLAYALAVLPTMLLMGLWHGAAWTFVAWGGFHGLLLALQRGLGGPARRWRRSRALRTARWWRPAWRVLQVVLTFHVVTLGWILFRAESLADAGAYLRGLFHGGAWTDFGWSVPFAALLLLLLDLGQQRWGEAGWLTAVPRAWRWVVAELLLVATLAAAVQQAHTVTPFIYFKF